MVWHELPVMYCFHRMPCTLKTCHNWPLSCSAIETYSQSDRQGRERGEEGMGRRDAKAL